MSKERKIKFNDNSKLFVKKIIAREKDNYGREIIRTRWFYVEGELNLGSLSKKQNEDIIEFKYEIPDSNKINPFKGLFG